LYKARIPILGHSSHSLRSPQDADAGEKTVWYHRTSLPTGPPWPDFIPQNQITTTNASKSSQTKVQFFFSSPQSSAFCAPATSGMVKVQVHFSPAESLQNRRLTGQVWEPATNAPMSSSQRLRTLKP
jgi:hypothetical protein